MSVAGRKSKMKPNQEKQKKTNVHPPIQKKKKPTTAATSAPSGGQVKKPHRFRPGTVAHRDAVNLTHGRRRSVPSLRWRPMQRLISQMVADRASDSGMPGASAIESISRPARFLIYFEVEGFMHRYLLRCANSMDPKRQRLTPANIARVRRDDAIRAGVDLGEIVPKHAAHKERVKGANAGARTVVAKKKKAAAAAAGDDEPTPVLATAGAEEEEEEGGDAMAEDEQQ